MPNDKEKKWPLYLSELVYAYNTTPHSSTGYSPYFLLFGHDLLLDFTEVTDSDNQPETWAEAHQKRLQEAYTIAKNRLKQAASVHKVRYDKHAKDSPLRIGERVYLRLRVFKGRNKIQDMYKSCI